MCRMFGAILLQVPDQDLNNEVVSRLSEDKSYFIALHDDEFLFSDCEYCRSIKIVFFGSLILQNVISSLSNLMNERFSLVTLQTCEKNCVMLLYIIP